MIYGKIVLAVATALSIIGAIVGNRVCR